MPDSVQTEKFLSKFRDLKTAVFIDSANLFYAQKRVNWKISWKKLYGFLNDNFKLDSVNFYLGMPQNKIKSAQNKRLISKLTRIGYRTQTKPLKKIYIYKDKFVYKCNFDVEISLDVAEKIDKLDLVIISSGDSDFLAIKNYCLKRSKKFLVLCFERNVAWELRLVHHLFFEKIRKLVEK